MPTKAELIAQQKAINEQLAAIEKAEQDEQDRIRRERETRIREALESMTPEQRLAMVDLVAPEHGRTSCSDEHPNNGWDSATNGRTTPRCNRCAMLETFTMTFDIPHGAIIALDLRYNAD